MIRSVHSLVRLLSLLVTLTIIHQEYPTSSSSGVDAFSSTSLLSQRRSLVTQVKLGIEPFLPEIAIATVSAAAGAASQIPKIQKLEHELDVAKVALTASEEEMVHKIHDLEERLHQMDDEFEQQTAKIQKKFDLTLRDKIAEVTAKAREDYQYKLRIEVNKEKSRMKLEELANLNVNYEKQAHLRELRLAKSAAERTNLMLEAALEDSERELLKLKELVESKNTGWWPF